mgnify:CR=1 FL=1
MHLTNGILFNHESPLRGETFVTRKITRAVARISQGRQDCLYLGNLDAQRDWGHARDYVDGMWRILQHPDPEDFVLATGLTTTVRAFTEKAFSIAGLETPFPISIARVPVRFVFGHSLLLQAIVRIVPPAKRTFARGVTAQRGRRRADGKAVDRQVFADTCTRLCEQLVLH